MSRFVARPFVYLSVAASSAVFALALAAATGAPPASPRPTLTAADRARLHSLAPPAVRCLGRLLPVWQHVENLGPWLDRGLRPTPQDAARLYQQGRSLRDACWSAATSTLALQSSMGTDPAHGPARAVAQRFYRLLVQAAMGAQSASSVGADLAVGNEDLVRGDLAEATRHLAAASGDDRTVAAIFDP
jgi:hypothetical protein